ncbi:Oxoglutarate/iron-dependent dioxygenase [Macleaya cordata]|uniref:Oxoglutarate/iron-dependent dioxygenase n=1 Tax=Macleaya cordata TaxID=56857 RepID=A0A200Q0H0_MACCD|nr:Oxoglutarate/iron-dependent dioxygenase [Macleaya cordata]
MEAEEGEEERRILKEVFGDSSDDEEDEDVSLEKPYDNIINPNPNWERIKEINGLWLCRDFLSLQQQASLISAIRNEGWFTKVSQNQAMRFGDLPVWAIELSASIREAICFSEYVSEIGGEETCDLGTEETGPLPSNLLWREPLFDQLITNVYQPGEGICAHIDLMRFEDGIAIVSLESSCVMHFTRAERQFCSSVESGEEKEDPLNMKIPILLIPGSLIVMSGEARYLWKHEINRKQGFQVWEGQEICQQKRTSVTLRKLCETK